MTVPRGDLFAARSGIDDEVSLLELMSVLLSHRGLVVRSIVLFAVISVAVALTKPTLYTSSGSFLPESTEGAPSGALALAQQFGIGVGVGGERPPQFYAGLVTSREILRQAVTRRYTLTPVEEMPSEADLINYEERFCEFLCRLSGAVQRMIPAQPSSRSEIDGVSREEEIELAIERLSTRLVVDVDVETGIVKLLVTTQDPLLSQGVAEALLELVNDFDLTTRQAKASADRRFAEARLAELTKEFREAEDSLQGFLLDNRLFTNSPSLEFEHGRLQRAVVMRQSLVTSLAQTFESARIEEVRNTPVITLIEPPRVPARRDRKGRVLIVFIGLIGGGMFGVFRAFLRNYWERERTKGNPGLEDLSALWREVRGDLTRFLPRIFRRAP